MDRERSRASTRQGRIGRIVVRGEFGPFFTISFDGAWPEQESEAIWEHFVVDGPFTESAPASHRTLRTDRPQTVA